MINFNCTHILQGLIGWGSMSISGRNPKVLISCCLKGFAANYDVVKVVAQNLVAFV